MSTPYVGEIRLFGFSRAPIDWLPCDGRLLSINDYQVLYVLLGTSYGGDGVNTFALPDLRGSVPVHQGTGLGLSTYVLGQVGGNEGITLIGAQMPTHSHTPYATGTNATTGTPSPAVMPGALTNGDAMYATDLTGASSGPLAPNAISNAGGSVPHVNTMPTLTLNLCIATAGVFPSQT